jgi:hypothetical protein
VECRWQTISARINSTGRRRSDPLRIGADQTSGTEPRKQAMHA